MPIDTSTLNTIHYIGADRAVVDAGVLWSQLLLATLERQLTPPVLTDYIELSVGGTLSVGGIGGASHRYGVQADNVLSNCCFPQGKRLVVLSASVAQCLYYLY